MQFQVPQNITMEDKIVGPFTAIQFGIVVVGWGLSFFIATSGNLPGLVAKALGVFLAFLTFIIAVGKFNDQPLYRFVKFFLAFLFKPKVRVWHKKGMEVHLVQRNPNAKNKEIHRPAKKVSKQDIAHLAVVLDSRGKSGVVPMIQVQLPASQFSGNTSKDTSSAQPPLNG